MRQLMLSGTDISVSRFIFGTASLFNAGQTSDRQRILDAAFDHGLQHFDTAPYYGFGHAERDLRDLLRRQSKATVTTKVGIYSPGGENQSAPAVFLRKAAGRVFPPLARPTHDWSVDRARQALEGSLRRLGRDHIDLYMLHEPDQARVDADAWKNWLERELKAGRIRAYGIAVDTRRLLPFLSQDNDLTRVIQTADSLSGREADQLVTYGRALQITYGYVSAAKRGNPQMDVRQTLSEALKRNRTGAVIVSTKKTQRMSQYAELAAQDDI